MTREEAITALGDRNNLLWGMSKEEQKYYSEALDVAISALSAEEIFEDGTLKVNVSDGSKVKRVLVWGDNIFGGLYYPDSAEPKASAEGEYIKKEDIINECISYADHENNVKFKKEVSERRKHDAEVIIYACEHFRKFVNGLPTYSFPDREKGEDRPKGHWIESGYVGNDNYLFECSECHYTDTQSKAVKVNYCWHCGADMRGDKAE